MDENDYKTTGTWDNTTISLSFNIPFDDEKNPYSFHRLYNISKPITVNNTVENVNTIVIYFKKERDNEYVTRAGNNEKHYTREFNISDFKKYPLINSQDFDPANDLFVIFFHDDTFEEKDLNGFHENLHDYYKQAEDSHDHFATNIQYLKKIDPVKPKRAGMSILRK